MTSYYNEIEPYAAEWLRNLIKAGLIPHGEVDTRSIVDVAPDDLRGFTQCHFFAGIGGWSHALRLAGWPDDRPIWTGSCPCQPFSVVGKGAGTDDPRHLWPHFHRLITAVRPPVVMGEQVAGAAGYGWLDGVRADLEREGYASRGVDIPACSVDAPHIRQRLYWVATDLADAGHIRRGDRPKSGEQELSPSSGSGAATVALVNPTGSGLEGHGQFGRVAEGGVREASIFVSGEGCGSGDMADAMCIGRQGSRALGEPSDPAQGRDREASDAFHVGSGADGGGDMADADYKSIRRGRPAEAHGAETSDAREAQQWEWVRADTGSNGRGGSGFWSDHIWLAGADGKSRRSKPGLPLLAYGILNRVGRLRAYGNAIVPQVAAEVIRAFLEAQEAA